MAVLEGGDGGRVVGGGGDGAGMRKLKEENCDAQPTAKAVKAIRNNCIAVFLKCKKAEDLAVSLVATCGDGAVKTKDGKSINRLQI